MYNRAVLTVTNLIIHLPRPAARLSFNLLEGKLLWVRGENGAGKSTLLKTLLGLIPSREGEIVWQGGARPSVFYLAHQLGLVPSLRVIDFCRWHPAIRTSLSEADCLAALKQVNLLPQAHQLCGQLSRGQEQRLLMACALLSEARLWVLDEPLTALDAPSRESVFASLRAHKAKGGAAILVSHYPIPELANEVIDVLA